MATTKILLREDIENLGGRGEIVKVKAGYARNYLLPQRLATMATKGNINQIEKERESLLKKTAQEKSTADAQAGQMSGISLSFERKAGEGGQLFGSVTSMDIAEALKAQGYEIDRRKIVLKDAIKETGDYTIGVKLHREVAIQIPVSVRGEGEIDAPKAEKPAAQSDDSAQATDDSSASEETKS
ncbi:MAG: 50S ribosomal protein L9 [Acidobacteriota bacterium]|nr:50S ribosomal protein L9 [Acidobacteriota bacterium]